MNSKAMTAAHIDMLDASRSVRFCREMCEYLNDDLKTHGVTTQRGTSYRVDEGKIHAAIAYALSAFAVKGETHRLDMGDFTKE